MLTRLCEITGDLQLNLTCMLFKDQIMHATINALGFGITTLTLQSDFSESIHHCGVT